MRIRRFNENTNNSDFISIDEVKDIISNLYDHNVDITIGNKWISFGTEAHLSNDKEDKDDIQAIVIGVSFKSSESVPFYCEYGVDSESIKKDDLSKVVEILKDVVDISSHLEGRGYDVSTEIVSYHIQITITRKGTLVFE